MFRCSVALNNTHFLQCVFTVMPARDTFPTTCEIACELIGFRIKIVRVMLNDQFNLFQEAFDLIISREYNFTRSTKLSADVLVFLVPSTNLHTFLGALANVERSRCSFKRSINVHVVRHDNNYPSSEGPSS